MCATNMVDLMIEPMIMSVSLYCNSIPCSVMLETRHHNPHNQFRKLVQSLWLATSGDNEVWLVITDIIQLFIKNTNLIRVYVRQCEVDIFSVTLR